MTSFHVAKIKHIQGPMYVKIANGRFKDYILYGVMRSLTYAAHLRIISIRCIYVRRMTRLRRHFTNIILGEWLVPQRAQICLLNFNYLSNDMLLRGYHRWIQ